MSNLYTHRISKIDPSVDTIPRMIYLKKYKHLNSYNLTKILMINQKGLTKISSKILKAFQWGWLLIDIFRKFRLTV